MDKIVIQGGRRLHGRVRTSGAKNAVLPILAATLMADGPCVIENVPDLSDVHLMLEILEELGVATAFDNGTLRTEVLDIGRSHAPYDLVSQIRASFCVLGPLLARRRKASVSLPGGCVIGVRPVDLHLKGLRALGADLQINHGYVEGEARLKGTHIFLGGAHGSSVTGTANVMMAAALAEGETVIEQAACEPEIQDLAAFINAMGGNIEGAGSPRITIKGVRELHGTTHRVIPDRVEAATFLVAAGITGGDVIVEDCQSDHMIAVIELLKAAGVQIDQLDATTLRARGGRHIRPVEATTCVYPGFPTDVQAQLMALLTVAEGLSVVSDTIYPDRFMHVAEYQRMGAQIRKSGNTAIVQGVEFLSGAPVRATDLRASAGLILAGLAATGDTEVHEIRHLDRGYEKIEQKLVGLGAAIERVSFVPRRRAEDRLRTSGRKRRAA